MSVAKIDTVTEISSGSEDEIGGKSNPIASGKRREREAESETSSEDISDDELSNTEQDPDDLALYKQMSYWPSITESRRRVKKY